MSSISGSVEFRYGRYKYMGWALPDSEDEQYVWVVFDITYDDHGQGQQMKIHVSETDVKRRKPHTPKYLAEGWCVDFLSRERGLQKGRVERACGYQADIIYYYIDEEGYPKKVEDKGVRFDRIIDVSMLRNNVEYIPFKKKEKVIIDNGGAEVIIGEVSRNADPSGIINVSVLEFSYGEKKKKSGIKEKKRKFGIKEKKENLKFHFTQLRKLETEEGSLRRSDFISDQKERDIAYNADVKERIKREAKRMNDAQLKEYPYPQQIAGCELADRYDRFAFFYDMGTGKTSMALNIVSNKYQKYGAKFLIIAPLAVIKTAWMNDQKTYFPDMRILPLHQSFKQDKQKELLIEWRARPDYPIRRKLKSRTPHREIREELEQYAQHYIINPELLITKPGIIDKYGITGLIMDESAVLKNYHGVTSTIVRERAKNLRFVYLLSGKPAPNNEIEYFSQMKIVAPDMFRFTYGAFATGFCCRDEVGRRIVRWPCRSLLADMVASRSLVVSKKDCLDLLPTKVIIRRVELPSKWRLLYEDLVDNWLASITDENGQILHYHAEWSIAVLMKLRQIASGFVLLESEREGNTICKDLHFEKVKELLRVLENIPSEQVIVWCQFKHEIELLESVLSKKATVVTAYGDTKDCDKSIEAFKEGKAKYIIALPQSLKYGVTFNNCTYAVYYSLSYSAEQYSQSHDRNYRLGQKKECTYIYLQTDKTIDVEIYDILMEKLYNGDVFAEMINHAKKIGVDFSKIKPKSKEEAEQEMARILNQIECDISFDDDLELLGYLGEPQWPLQ